MKNQQPKIELRKDVPRPYWRLRLFVPTPDGLRRRNFNLGFRDETTRKKANKARLTMLAKVNGGHLHDSGGMTFADLVVKFTELRLPTLKPTTANFYRQVIDRYLLPYFGKYALEQVNRLQVETFVATKVKLATSTRRGLLATLSVLFTAAVDWHAVDHNPVLGVKLGRQVVVRPKAIPSAEQFQELLTSLPANMSLLVRLLAVTGLRISEAAGLRWSDIDWQRGTVSVQRRWYRGDLDTPKTPASLRPRWVGPLLAELKQLRPAGDGYLFAGEDGQPLDEQKALRDEVRPVLRRIGLPAGNGWHCLRRLHVSLLQQAGGSGLEVMKLVGHTSLTVTEKYTVVEQAREQVLVSGVCERLLLSA